MSMSVGRPVSPTVLPPAQSQVKVAQPVVSELSVQTASKPLNTQESFGAARQSVVGKTSETVNPSQGGQQIKQGIDQSDGEQLLEQGQTLMGSTVVKEEFGDGASALPKLSPPTPLPPPPPPPKVSSVSPKSGGSSITPDMLVQARQNLKPVSQHQVLNLEKADTTVTESSRSVVLKDEGSAFAPERLTAKSTLEIVGHGASDGSSIGGLNPKQLAQKLKQEGITQLAVLDLKSCYSEGFKTELEGALKEAGITVGGIRTYEGQIGISRETGKVLQGVELEQTEKHDGVLPGKAPPEIPQTVKKHLEGIKQAAQKLLTGLGFTQAEIEEDYKKFASAVFSMKEYRGQKLNLPGSNPIKMKKYEFIASIGTELGNAPLKVKRLYKWLTTGQESVQKGSITSLKVLSSGHLTGRPGFSRALDNILGKTVHGDQHLRHITAWHSIKNAMNIALNLGNSNVLINDLYKFAISQSNKYPLDLNLELSNFIQEMPNDGKSLANPTDDFDKLKIIMYIMNSNPNNLWPGDGTQNISFNSTFHRFMDVISTSTETTLKQYVDERVNNPTKYSQTTVDAATKIQTSLLTSIGNFKENAFLAISYLEVDQPPTPDSGQQLMNSLGGMLFNITHGINKTYTQDDIRDVLKKFLEY